MAHVLNDGISVAGESHVNDSAEAPIRINAWLYLVHGLIDAHGKIGPFNFTDTSSSKCPTRDTTPIAS